MLELENQSKLYVRQMHEVAEWFGFESRNKYQILGDGQLLIGYAAEQQKGLLGFLGRQLLGHWRRFDIHIFDNQRQLALIGRHPFRFIFQRLEIFDAEGTRLGAIQQRFSIFFKRFDVESSYGDVLFKVQSPFWRIWTFPLLRQGRQVALVQKKWTGLLMEAFTDKDCFEVELSDPGISPTERSLILASALFIDLQYFERKAGD